MDRACDVVMSFLFVCGLIVLRLDHFFFFNDTATTEIYTLSLHDALPIRSNPAASRTKTPSCASVSGETSKPVSARGRAASSRSEEHTSELQSQSNLVCRLLLEKKKNSILMLQ